MSTLRILTFSMFIALVFIPLACSVDLLEIAPSPPPEVGSDGVPAPSNLSPGTSPSASPSPSHSLNSPPAPPPSDLAPGSSPAPAPSNATAPKDKSPAPAPAPAPGVHSDISHAADSGDIEASESSGGMKSGQKAGIAVGVIAGVFIVGVGAIVYKKRQQNIRRAEFGFAARRDIL